MSAAEQFIESDDLHPIDIVEHIAEHHAWEFDRVADDQIAMLSRANGAPIPSPSPGRPMTRPCV